MPAPISMKNPGAQMCVIHRVIVDGCGASAQVSDACTRAMK